MLKLLHAFIFLSVSVCYGMLTSERFVISSAYCIGDSWSLVIFDKATGEKFKIDPTKRCIKKSEYFFENFNSEIPSIVMRTNGMRYIVKMQSALKSTEKSNFENGDFIQFESCADNDEFLDNTISRNRILNYVTNLN